MQDLIIRQFGTKPYDAVWEKMRAFTDQRQADTVDELWYVEHPPVFTQGLAGKPEHILNPHDIPIVQTDRGGQVTYHGPGQLMAYLLFDINRLQLNTRGFVRKIEATVVDYLNSLEIRATTDPNAPGVYVHQQKICSIGLRLRQGFSYHGLALNVDMDLTPFSYINPCGFKGLSMTQIRAFSDTTTIADVKRDLIPYILSNFGYNPPTELVAEDLVGVTIG